MYINARISFFSLPFHVKFGFSLFFVLNWFCECAKRVVTSQIMFFSLCICVYVPMLCVFFALNTYNLAFSAAIQVWQQIQFHLLSALVCFDSPITKIIRARSSISTETGINQFDSSCWKKFSSINLKWFSNISLQNPETDDPEKWIHLCFPLM